MCADAKLGVPSKSIYVCGFKNETVCQHVSYWFNFPLYEAVNECHLKNAPKAHKRVCIETADLVKLI